MKVLTVDTSDQRSANTAIFMPDLIQGEKKKELIFNREAMKFPTEATGGFMNT